MILYLHYHGLSHVLPSSTTTFGSGCNVTLTYRVRGTNGCLTDYTEDVMAVPEPSAVDVSLDIVTCVITPNADGNFHSDLLTGL